MTYVYFVPPFKKKFVEMSANELSDYKRWFFEVMPSRIAGLQREVNLDAEMRDWCPDHTRASIESLGVWLARHVEARPRTPEEIDRIKGRLTFDVNVEDWQLTDKTSSLAVDIGMYFGETLRANFPTVEWYQPIKDKRYVDFGQVILRGFGRAETNPVRVAANICRGLVRGRESAKSLVDVYDRWASSAADAAKSLGSTRL